jgi:hypothetical protein
VERFDLIDRNRRRDGLDVIEVGAPRRSVSPLNTVADGPILEVLRTARP